MPPAVADPEEPTVATQNQTDAADAQPAQKTAPAKQQAPAYNPSASPQPLEDEDSNLSVVHEAAPPPQPAQRAPGAPPVMPWQADDADARHADVYKTVDKQMGDQWNQEHPFAPSGWQPQTPPEEYQRALRQSDLDARDSLRGKNAQIEQQMRGSGQKYYRDANGLVQPMIDQETGKLLYEEGKREQGIDPDTKQPAWVSRDKFGQKQYDSPELMANPTDPNDKQLYADFGNEKQVPYGNIDDLIKSPNFKVARAALKARNEQQSAVWKQAIQPMQDVLSATNEAYDAAKMQHGQLGQTAYALQQQIDAIDKDPKFNETAGGVMGFGGSPTDAATKLQSQRAMLQNQLDQTTKAQADLGTQIQEPDKDHAPGPLWQKKQEAQLNLALHKAAATYHAHVGQTDEIKMAGKQNGIPDDQNPTLAANAQAIDTYGRAIDKFGGALYQGIKNNNPAAVSPDQSQPPAVGVAQEPYQLAASGIKGVGGVSVQALARNYGSGNGDVTPASLVKMSNRLSDIKEMLADKQTSDVMKPSLQKENDYLNSLYLQRFNNLDADKKKAVINATRDPTLKEKLTRFARSAVGTVGEGVLDAAEFATRHSPIQNDDPGIQETFQKTKDAIQTYERSQQNAPGDPTVSPEVQEKLDKSFVTGTAPQLVGQLVPMFLSDGVASVAGRAAGLSEKTVGLLGKSAAAMTSGAQQGNQMRREAINTLKPQLDAGKISKEDYSKAVGLAEIAGTTLGMAAFIPFARVSQRISGTVAGKTFLSQFLNYAAKGGNSSALKWLAGDGGKKALADVVREGIQTSGVGFVQTLATDVAAKNIYDPTRKVSATKALEGADNMGFVGVFMSALSHVVPHAMPEKGAEGTPTTPENPPAAPSGEPKGEPPIEPAPTPPSAEAGLRESLLKQSGEKPAAPTTQVAPAPAAKPAPATFAHMGSANMDEAKAGKASVEFYHLNEDIPDHPKGSTVSRDTLEKAGYQVPEKPTETTSSPPASLGDKSQPETSKPTDAGLAATELKPLPEGATAEHLGKQHAVVEGHGAEVDQWQVKMPGEQGRGHTMTAAELAAQGFKAPEITEKPTTEDKSNATKIEGSTGVDVRKQTGNGETVGGGNAVDQGAAGARQEKAGTEAVSEKPNVVTMKPDDLSAELNKSGIKTINGKPLKSANHSELMSAVFKNRKANDAGQNTSRNIQVSDKIGSASLVEKGEKTGSLSTDEAQKAVDDWKAKNPNAPKNIKVINDPEWTQDGKGVRGFHHNGEITINAAHATDAASIHEVLNHEHAHDTLASKKGKVALSAFATREIPAEQMDALKGKYAQRDGESPADYKLRLVNEWVAQNAEKNPGVFGKIVEAVKGWLAKRGLATLTNEQAARAMLRNLRESGSSGAETTEHGNASVKEEPEEKKAVKPEPVKGQPGKFYRSLPDTEREANAEVVRQTYQRRSQQPDLEAAQAIIDHHGADKAMSISMSKADDGVPLPVKSAIYVKLGEAADKRVVEAKTPQELAKAVRARQSLSTAKSPAATEQGQQIAMYAQINKNARSGSIQQHLDDVQTEQTKRLGSDGKKAVDEATKAIDGAKNKAIERATKALNKATQQTQVTKDIWQRYRDSAAQRMIDLVDSSVTPPKEKAPLQEFAQRVVSELQSRIKPLLPEKPGGKPPPSPGDLLREAIDNKDKYGDVLTTVRKAFVDKYGEGGPLMDSIDTELANLGLHPYSEKLVDHAINDAHKLMQTSVAQIAKEHFTKSDAKAGDFADALVRDAGLSGADAANLAAEITERTKSIYSEERDKAIESLKKRFANTLKAKKIFDAVSKATSLNNIGALTRADVQDAVANELHLPNVKPEQLKKIADLADKVETAENPASKARATLDLADEMRKARQGGKWAKAIDTGTSIWYANMLAGTATIVKTGGDILNSLGQMTTAIAANPAHANTLISGWLDGLGAGWERAKATISEGKGGIGYNPLTGGYGEAGTAPHKLSSLEDAKNPYTGALKYVPRAFKAIEAFFYQPAREAYAKLVATKLLESEYSGKELNAKVQSTLGISPSQFELFTKQAKVEGFKGTDLGLRVGQLIEQHRNKSDVGNQAQSLGAKFGEQAVYRQEPTGVAGAIYRVLNDAVNNKIKIAGVPVLKPFMPFLRIPTNLFNESMNYTPLGAKRALVGTLDAEGKAPVEMNSDDRTRLLIKSVGGTMLMGALTAMALDKSKDKTFDISGAGPRDYNKRVQLQQTGWAPHSIKIGDRWYNYMYSPLMIPLTVVGNVSDSLKYQKQRDEMLLSSHVADAIGGAGRAVMDTSMLQGLSQLMDFAKGSVTPNRFGKFLASTATSAVIPNGVRQIDMALSPTQHKDNGPFGVVGSEIPFVRRLGSERTDALGSPMTYSPTQRFSSGVKPDALRDTLNEKNVFVSTPSRDTKIGNRVMTEHEYDFYQKLSGQRIKSRLEEMLPELRSMTSEEADKQIKEIERDERQKVRGIMPKIK